MAEGAGKPRVPEGAGKPRGPERADALLQRLEWTVLKRLDGLLQGDWRTLRRGHGVDLADLREYQLHDDVRHIDWNVTARLQVPHVRQYTEDRDLTAWFLLDLSASVDFGSQERTKRAVLSEFVAAMARLLTRHGNRVGAVLYSTRVDRVLPPGSSRRHVLELLARVGAPQPAPVKRAEGAAARVTGSKTSGDTATALADLLHAAEGTLKRRSLVFVVSDFISTPGWEAPLGRLARRHDVVAVRVLDPMEMALPDVGLVTVEDAETGEQLFVDSADPAFRARYESIAQSREAALRESLGASGADTLELATEDDLLDALLRYCDLRRQRARRRVPVRFPAAFLRAGVATPAAEATSSGATA